MHGSVTLSMLSVCMIPEATGPTVDDSPEIVPRLLVSEAHSQMPDSTLQLPTDVAPSGEALTIMVNGCKVSINNNACRDVIYHTISALREL